jgi:pyruvate formate lyase activating enzyme
MVFDIQRYSTHDGEGIRTTVFFKGCPLRCAWCENPEGQDFGAELLYDPAKCILCLECARLDGGEAISAADGSLHIRRDRIRDPELYRDVCPARALQVVGRDWSVEEILREIQKDLPFYRRSAGGVTLAGGEPYAQPGLALDLLRGLERLGIPAAVETTLLAPWKHIEPTLRYVGTFLADLKHMDGSKFRDFTGGNLKEVLQNFRRLEAAQARVVPRVPVIPGFNDSIEEIRRIVDFAASLRNVREIHFLPFHVLGTRKYTLIGKRYGFLERVPDWGRRLQEYENLAGARGLRAAIGG